MNRILSLSAMLCLSLFFSCAPDIGPIPEYPSSSGTSSSDEAVLGSSSSLSSSGSNVSVISSSSRVSSSSAVIPSSSSSVKPSSGSGTYCLDYDWQECTPSNGKACPDWSTPSDSCPSSWNSSSSSKPSSSSSVSSSSVVPSSSSAPSSSSVAVPLSSSATQCVQSIGFTTDPDDSEKKNYMCASVRDNCNGQIIRDIHACGPDISKRLGWSVDFYMLRRSNVQDTIWLNPTKNNECKGNAKDFTCYGGILIKDATYSCGGAVRCQGNAKATANVEIIGSWNVCAHLMTENGEPVENIRPLIVDRFESDIDEELSMKLKVANP
jgi:hypothetical protein